MNGYLGSIRYREGVAHEVPARVVSRGGVEVARRATTPFVRVDVTTGSTAAVISLFERSDPDAEIPVARVAVVSDATGRPVIRARGGFPVIEGGSYSVYVDGLERYRIQWNELCKQQLVYEGSSKALHVW